MKKILIFVFVVAIAATSFGQKIAQSKVPAIDTVNLKNRFPLATNVQWEQKDTVYSAEFLMDDMKTEAEFDAKGIWICTEWEIPLEYTPQTIKDTIGIKFPGYKIKELNIVDLPAKGTQIAEKIYVAEIAKKKDVQEVSFSLKGEFKKAEAKLCEKKTKCNKKKKPGDKQKNG